jgi:hypothetical protein
MRFLKISYKKFPVLLTRHIHHMKSQVQVKNKFLNRITVHFQCNFQKEFISPILQAGKKERRKQVSIQNRLKKYQMSFI